MAARLLFGWREGVSPATECQAQAWETAKKRKLAARTNMVRQELLSALAELSAACPEMRFGQLIANLSTLAGRDSAEGLWDAEDEEMLAAAREQLAYFVEHRPAPEEILKE
jgi:hypothetical protein